MRDRSSAIPLDVILVNAATLVAAAIAALRSGNSEFVFYIVVLVLLIAFVAILHGRIGFSRGVLRGLTLWVVLHMAGGLVPVPASWPIDGGQRVLYSLWIVPQRLKYDQFVHAFGFGVTAWAFWQALNRSFGVARPTIGALLVCFFGAMGCGAMNEVVEFAATRLVPETNVGGYENTGWDLVANAVGAFVAVFLVMIRVLR